MTTMKFRTPVSTSGLVLAAAVALSMAAVGRASAGEPAPKAKAPIAGKATAAAMAEVTLKGEMTCSKCGLHEPGKCQNVLRVKDPAGKETRYYLAKNSVSDEHHEKVCSATAPATVTGKVSDDGGKKVITASTVKFD